MKWKTLLMTVGLFALFSACKKDSARDENILYQTDFSTDDGKLWTGTDGNLTASIEDGRYHFNNANTSGFYWNTFPDIFTGISDGVAMETSIKISANADDTPGAGGLIWQRKPATNADFEFWINSEGAFKITGYPDGENYITYKDWALHSSIKPNGFNRLRLEIKEGQWFFYINGTRVHQMEAVSSGTADKCGLFASYLTTLEADYFKTIQL
ncbi:hypothetical protein GCM10027051_11740 [Niabella terrae]